MHTGINLRRSTFRRLAAGALILGMTLTPVRLSAADEPAATGAPSQADLDVQTETESIASARRALAMDDEQGADTALMARLSARSQGTSSVTLARRAAGVCGWLQSDNDYTRAERLAARVVRRLSNMSEDTDADRVERLYWEAWLEGYALDHKARALELLQEAAQLAPDDQRILEDSLRWAEALAAFGH